MLKKSMVFLFVLVIAAFSFTVVFAAERGFISNKQQTAVTADNQKCPVMGYAVNRDVKVTFDGKTYYFCCNSCVKKFKDNPSKFINPNFTKVEKASAENCLKAGCECVNCSCGQKCECGMTCAQNKANCVCCNSCGADKKMECKNGSCFQDKMKIAPAKMKCGGGSCSK